MSNKVLYPAVALFSTTAFGMDELIAFKTNVEKMTPISFERAHFIDLRTYDSAINALIQSPNTPITIGDRTFGKTVYDQRYYVARENDKRIKSLNKKY